MTLQNVPIAVGFTVITISQFALGVWMTVLAAKSGGKVLLFDGMNHSHSKCRRVPLRSRLLPRSRTETTDTARRISIVHFCSASYLGDRVHKCLPPVRCVREIAIDPVVIPLTLLIAFAHIRHLDVRIHHFPCKKVKGTGVQVPVDLG